jgi:hypothetical protein
MTLTKRTRLGLLAAAALMATPLAAHAQWWRNHPHYPRAMADLRAAYWMVRGGTQPDPLARLEEQRALTLIRYAYLQLRNAQIVDNGDIDAAPPPDPVWADRRGRLHRAYDLLQDANNEVMGEADDPAALGFRNRALVGIHNATGAVYTAIRAWGY